MSRRPAALGLAAVASAAVLWAAFGSYARTLIDRGASPLEITEARAWIALAGLAAIVWVRRRRGTRPRPAAPPHPGVVVAFGLSIAGANYFYYSAIARLPVAVAIVIQYTAPALVVGWLALVAHRRPSRRVAAAMAVALAGVALLAGLPDALSAGGTGLSGAGVAAAVASAVAFAVYILTGERLEAAHGAEGSLLRGFAVASAIWVVVQATHGRPDTLLDPSLVPGVVALGVGATTVPFLLFVWGLGRIGASRAGVVSTLEPLSGAFIAYLWLGQSLDGVQIAGAAMVIAGIAVVQSERAEAAPAPAPVD